MVFRRGLQKRPRSTREEKKPKGFQDRSFGFDENDFFSSFPPLGNPQPPRPPLDRMQRAAGERDDE